MGRVKKSHAPSSHSSLPFACGGIISDNRHPRHTGHPPYILPIDHDGVKPVASSTDPRTQDSHPLSNGEPRPLHGKHRDSATASCQRQRRQQQHRNLFVPAHHDDHNPRISDQRPQIATILLTLGQLSQGPTQRAPALHLPTQLPAAARPPGATTLLPLRHQRKIHAIQAGAQEAPPPPQRQSASHLPRGADRRPRRRAHPSQKAGPGPPLRPRQALSG
jgi:hypothetical protein